jgi:hypothetical protein
MYFHRPRNPSNKAAVIAEIDTPGGHGGIVAGVDTQLGVMGNVQLLLRILAGTQARQHQS